MSARQDFLQYADRCKRLIEDGDVTSHRQALYSMAHAWRQLADEEERIADFVRAVDGLFLARRSIGVGDVFAPPLTTSGLVARS